MSTTIWGASLQGLGLGLPGIILSNPALSILLPITLGTAVGYSTRPKDPQKTYTTIRQPPLRPPSWLFGPVWTILYGLMGYSIHRAYLTSSSHIISSNPLSAVIFPATSALYTTQLALNLLWMPLFFTFNQPALALGDILLLGVSICGLTVNYFRIDTVAGYCMLPYLGWVGFATYLNAGAGYLNGWDVSGGGNNENNKELEEEKK